MKTGIELISKERKRQLKKFGCQHDRGHTSGQLVKVAAVLQLYHTDARIADPLDFIDGNTDPWGLSEKLGNNEIDRLVVAGALIAAEIDRLNAARV